jgi:hypothetical protein
MLSLARPPAPTSAFFQFRIETLSRLVLSLFSTAESLSRLSVGALENADGQTRIPAAEQKKHRDVFGHYGDKLGQ